MTWPIAVLVASALLFAWMEPFPSLSWPYAIAVTGSILSYGSMARLPDAPPPPRVGWRDTVSNLTRMTFTGYGYRTYLWISVGYYALTTPRLPYAVYHLKADTGISSGKVLCPPT
jgi:hypothetical protein